MTRLANILFAAPDAGRARVIAEVLTRRKFGVRTVAGIELLRTAARDRKPDLVMLDAAGADALAWAAEMARDPVTDRIPRVLVGADGSPATYRSALATRVDEVFEAQTQEDEMLLRLAPLLRLSTMAVELDRRATQVCDLGIRIDASAAPNLEAEPARILMLGGDGGLGAALTRASGGRASITVAADAFVAEDRLNEQPFDACVVSLDGSGAADALEFTGHIRNNPRLFNLPVVALASPGTAVDPLAACRGGVTRLVPGPAAADALRYALTTLVRRQRWRWSLRQGLEATRQGAARDPVTDAYTLAFLQRHLQALVEAARAWRKHLTLVFFSVPGLADVRAYFGADAALQLSRQLAHWIMGLVRIEDLTARYNDEDFCVALPDTPLADARIVIGRIAGILSHTDFALRNVYQPVSVAVEVAMAELAAEDSADRLIARARETLD